MEKDRWNSHSARGPSQLTISAASQPAPQAPPGRAADSGERIRIDRGELPNERRFVCRRLRGALTRRAAPRNPAVAGLGPTCGGGADQGRVLDVKSAFSFPEEARSRVCVHPSICWVNVEATRCSTHSGGPKTQDQRITFVR